MQAVNLPLFSNDSQNINTHNQSSDLRETTEDKIIVPLTQVLEEITPKPLGEQPRSQEITPSFKQSLDNLFPEQQYDEKHIQKAKEILGKLAEDMSQEQLKMAVTEIQFLAESWLDDFERGVFRGLTLQELLHEKGGV